MDAYKVTRHFLLNFSMYLKLYLADVCVCVCVNINMKQPHIIYFQTLVFIIIYDEMNLIS